MNYGNYPDLREVRRVLVIKLRHLGDVLLIGPVLSALKRALPDAHIDALVYQEAISMLEGHPALSEVIAYNRSWKRLSLGKRILAELRFLLRIRKKAYDLVINLTEGDRGAFVSRVSRARIKVGVDARRVYTYVAKPCPSLRHTVERNLDVLRKIGLIPEEVDKELVFMIPQEAYESSVKKVSWERFILVHPTSRWRFKCWPVQQMRELVLRLIEKGEKIVLTSGPDTHEVVMVEAILKDLPQDAVCDLAGKVSLKELGALIARSSRMVCVDSVAFHIASALKARVIALFGPTSEVTWGAWQNPKASIVAARMSCRPCYLDGCGGSKRSECLYAITVEQVLSELELVAEVGVPCLRIINEIGNGSR